MSRDFGVGHQNRDFDGAKSWWEGDEQYFLGILKCGTPEGGREEGRKGGEDRNEALTIRVRGRMGIEAQ
jgi:hypothetical protein